MITGQVAGVNNRVAALQAALAEVDLAICPSNFLMQTYLDKGFHAKQMRFLRQGLVHIPQQPPQKSPAPQLRVGYIGQIAPHKGVHLLIDAFLKLGPMVQKMQLKLYGDTTQFPDFYHDLQQRVTQTDRAQEQIHFMGTFYNQQISQVYQEIDILVVPSVWYENSPNVILEAFAHQTPVITSNLGGMAELVVDQKTGLLFEPNNAGDLAQKLQQILDNPAILDKLQQNIDLPTTISAEMAELLQIYQTVLSQAIKQTVTDPV
jgi:glycosyltransferase involved in cell wall biosynthesis